MNTLLVAKCKLTAIIDAPEFPELLVEYAHESAMEGMPSANAKLELYRQFEAAGALTTFGAWMGTKLVGFFGILYHVLPHYSVGLAVSESFFVTKSARASGAGLKLKKLGEEHARAIGSPGLLISAPVGSDLDAVLASSTKYRPASNAYFTRFA